MAKKFYAVKKGKKTGVFESWDACKMQVDGFSGAVFKSFKTKEEALAYLGEACETQKKGDSDGKRENGPSAGCVEAYVDGSYNRRTKEFSYGMVILQDGHELKFSEKYGDRELASMHNVAGEIKGAQAAMQYAADHFLGGITIYHDYEGIAKWCTGEWKTNKDGTKAYKAFYDSIKDKVSVKFIKVTAHSNNKYNDMADVLAKQALGLR